MFYFNFRLLFYAQALREYLVPGDCYFFFCSFIVYMFVIEKKYIEKTFAKILQKLTGKHLCHDLFLIKLEAGGLIKTNKNSIKIASTTTVFL